MSDLSALLGALNNTDAGGCPLPFISESRYPYHGGFAGGRNCAVNPLVADPNAARCCIPCPIFDWAYGDTFQARSRSAGITHIVGFSLCTFLLISMAALPAKYTRAAFLNIMLLVGICILSLGFIIPFGHEPIQCFDPVTPNDLNSDMTCAWGGSLVTFGGLVLLTWMLVRALFMHLQVCWNFVPGMISYITANVVCWSLTIIFTAVTLSRAGVSYRFGTFCYLNVGSIATYWGWIFAFAGLAFLLQLATFAYCVKVYVSARNVEQGPFSSSNQSNIGSTKPKKPALIALQRVQKVLLLQWRALAIVIVTIIIFAFVCVVFMVVDDRLTVNAFNNVDTLIPWLLCIITKQDSNKCTHLTSGFIVSDKVAIATLYALGILGIVAFFLLCLPDVFVGWWYLSKKLYRKRGRLFGRSDDDLGFDMMLPPASGSEPRHSSPRLPTRLPPHLDVTARNPSPMEFQTEHKLPPVSNMPLRKPVPAAIPSAAERMQKQKGMF